MADDLEGLADRLRSASETAQSQDFRAADPGGLIEVTVDGRPRVVTIRVHPDAFRDTPDLLDELFTGLLNDAIGQARAATRQALLTALPEPVRTEIQAAADRPPR